MATRLYLASTGAAPFDPAIADGGWERNSGAYVARTMRTTKQDTALTTLSAVFGATATSQTRYATFVSPRLGIDQTISGNFSLVIGKCAETSTSGDAHLAHALRVTTSAGVHRATLHTRMATSTEFPLIANAATRIQTAAAVTSFAAAATDRLVLEIGIHGVTPANETMQMRIGDPTATSDFALTAGLTTDLDPWMELSQDIIFGADTGAASDDVLIRFGSMTQTTGSGLVTPTFTTAGGGAAVVGGMMMPYYIRIVQGED